MPDTSEPEVPPRIVRIARKHLYYPHRLVVEIAADAPSRRAGTRGRIATVCGTSMYDWHLEVPVDGTGVEHAHVVVVERHEDGEIVRTPYLAWCRGHGLELTCSRCGLDILRTAGAPCPGWVRQRARQDAARAAKQALAAHRRAWAAQTGAPQVPFEPRPRDGAHQLGVSYDTLDEARREAPAWQYDHAGVHVVIDRDWFVPHATAMSEPADGAPHPFGDVDERSWPIPVLVGPVGSWLAQLDPPE
jgi:hypothetical protein